MDKVLDLKNKHKQEDEELHVRHSPLKQIEEKLSERPPIKGPIPIMLSWRGPLFHHSPNPKLLAISLCVLYATALFFIFVQRSILASIFFILAATMLWITSYKSSPMAEFTVGPLSVKVDSKEYPFSEIKSFWIEYYPDGLKELSLQLDKWYMPFTKIPLMDEDPVQITAILLKFVPEIEHKESIIDSFVRMLGV